MDLGIWRCLCHKWAIISVVLKVCDNFSLIKKKVNIVVESYVTKILVFKPAFPLDSCVALKKLRSLSESQSLPLPKKLIINYKFIII